jgi:hypothetical protein
VTDEGLGIAEPRPIRRWLIRFGIALTLLSILYVGGAAIAVQGLPEKVARLQVIWENARFGERMPVRGPGREGNAAEAYADAWRAMFVDAKNAADRERLPAILAALVRRGAERRAFDFRPFERVLSAGLLPERGLAELLASGPSEDGIERIFDILWQESDLVRSGRGLYLPSETECGATLARIPARTGKRRLVGRDAPGVGRGVRCSVCRTPDAR